MPDRRPLLERDDLKPEDRKRIGRVVASLLGWWLVATASIAALVVWLLIRRGRRLVAKLDPPKIVRLPELTNRADPPA
ncbi:hypothetical protein TA3x_005218 [Tundrisphaera sp. TA3]|uniref:hypothetical protein n=1 Tax=Tundrisphaera sp. TA3 TaxID=3435775 RepID=UPI003EBF0171